MEAVFSTLLVIIAITLIGVILVQHGKGADAGTSFGSGASNTMFGPPPRSNFITRLTTVLAVLFLVIAMFLTILGREANDNVNELEDFIGLPTQVIGEDAQDGSVGTDTEIIPLTTAPEGSTNQSE